MTSRIDFARQTTIITGASSGIGAALARALSARGSTLVLVARRAERLDALAAELTTAHGVRVVPISLDLSSPTAASQLRSSIEAAGLRPTSLINNAGFGTFGAFADEDPGRLAAEIAVDVAAPVQLTAEFLPDLLGADRGYLINVASMAAYTPTPRMAVYAAAKAFVLSFTEALSAELRGTNVTVFALSPGATSTEFNDVVGTEDATSGAKKRTPEHVVATALAHLQHRNPAASVIDGRGNRLAAALTRFASRRATLNLVHRLTTPSPANNAPTTAQRI